MFYRLRLTTFKTAILAVFLVLLVNVLPSQVRAATSTQCDCKTVWAGSFSGDDVAIQTVTQEAGSAVFCATSAAACTTYCNQKKTEAETGTSVPDPFPTPKSLADDCFGTSEASAKEYDEGVCSQEVNSSHQFCAEYWTSGRFCPRGSTCIKNPLGVENISVLIGNIINAVLGFVGAVALLMFIYGGLLWLTSGGSADKVNQGKQVMVWATIGLVIIFSSYALVRFVFGFFTSI